MRAFVADKPGKQAMISRLQPLEFDGSRAVIGCAPAALTAISGQSRALADLIHAVLGRPVQVTITQTDRVATPPAAPLTTPQTSPRTHFSSPAATTPGPEEHPGASIGPSRAPARGPVEAPPEVRDHPLVRQAEAIFGARIVGVRGPSGE